MSENGTILPLRRYRISLKETWAGTWLAQEAVLGDQWLHVASVTLSASPQISQAEFLWRYGNVLTETATAFQLATPLENIVDGWFVMVEVIDVINGAEQNPVAIFHGVFVSDTRAVHSPSSGDQAIQALGLEFLLDRVAVESAWITNNNESAIEIDHVPAFNDGRPDDVEAAGNRSAIAVGSSYVFGPTLASVSGEAVWTNWDIIQYLLAHYAPSGVTFTLSGEADSALGITADQALADLVQWRLNLGGRSVREALDLLIDRRRGFGWRIRVVGSTVNVHVFGVVGTAITGEEFTLPGQDTWYIVYNDDLSIGEVVTHRDTQDAYGTIRVMGERVKVMFTASFADGTLAKAWTDADETSYASPGGSTAAEKDAARATERYKFVYQAYRIPDSWDWIAKNGEAGAGGNVAISFNDAGEFLVDTQANQRRWGGVRRLLPHLLIQREFQVDEKRAEYIEPFAVIVNPMTSSGFWRLDKPPVADFPAVSLRVMQTDFGVVCDANPNHVMGKGTFATSASGSVAPSYDYRNVIITAAVELDNRLRIVETIEDNDADRVLTINVPGAEFWWMVPGTIRGINADGTLDRVSTEWTTDDYALRDDRERLKAIAAAAKIWYGSPRATIVVQWKDLITGYLPGHYISKLLDREKPEQLFQEIGTVISSVTWNFDAGTTELRTQFSEIDFSSLRQR